MSTMGLRLSRLLPSVAPPATVATPSRVYLREWSQSGGLVGLLYAILLYLTTREMEAARRVASWVAKAVDEAAALATWRSDCRRVRWCRWRTPIAGSA